MPVCLEMPEIVLDGMLGKLSRWLRLLGVKTVYLKDVDDAEITRFLRLHSDSFFLTRDRTLHATLEKTGLKSLLVPEGREEDVLAWVLERLGVEPVFEPEKALCSICGSPLRKVGRDEVLGKIPERVLNAYSEFYVCTGCGQVYWLGTHVIEIKRRLEKVRCIIYGKAVC